MTVSIPTPCATGGSSSPAVSTWLDLYFCPGVYPSG